MSSSSSIGNYLGPFAQAQAVMRHPAGSFCKATVNVDPDCVTSLSCILNIMVAATTTYPRSPLSARACEGHCIWSSMVEKFALSLSAFLISSALTNGYSPYSRKLGH
jgi:hypothetical protein